MTKTGLDRIADGSPDRLVAQLKAEGAFRRLLDASVQKVERNRALQLTGEATNFVLLVLDGWLIVSKSTEDGQQQIVDFVLPGEFFDPGSAKRSTASADLTALTPSTVAALPRAGWEQFLEDHPDHRRALSRRVGAGYSRIAERLLRVGKSQAETRIAYAICELCLRSTEQGLVDGNGFHIPLTQQVLGDFVGLSSVHVSRTLRRLRRQKVLETGDHLDIVVHDVDRLAQIAEVDLDDLRAQIIPAP
jgi:CRP-like cAMP-binding protein